MALTRIPFAIVLLGSVALVGCVDSPQASLEKVAKDWSLTVRASQLMPIYPLEQDIRPGDVYLVTQTVDQEVTSWKKKGFLPLQNRFDRIHLPSTDYDRHYDNAFEEEGAPSFRTAPLAAFPSYSFKVDRRGALGLAIPLNSVPVALSASGAQEASGSVVFKDAQTQGLPDKTMESVVAKWARQNTDVLRAKGSTPSRSVIVRVVTRVYRVKGASVSIAFSKTSGAAIDAGSSPGTPPLSPASQEGYSALITELEKEVTLQKLQGDDPSMVLPSKAPEAAEADDSAPSTKASAAKLDGQEKQLELLRKLKAAQEMEAYQRRIERKSSEDAYGGYLLPGGSVRVSGRSARGVSMEETFAKPLVLGFLAQEYLVTPEGRLIPVGNTKDLIENPAAYRKAVQEAFLWRGTPTTPTDRYDNPDPATNPFKKSN